MFSAGRTLTLIVCIILHVRKANTLGYHHIPGVGIYTQLCSCDEVSDNDDVEQLDCTFTFASNVSACLNSPCKNDGACFKGTGCVCPAGFSGVSCEHVIPVEYFDNYVVVDELVVVLDDLVGAVTYESCAASDDVGDSSREEVSSKTAIDMTKELCGNPPLNYALDVGTLIVTASAVKITLIFCKYKQSGQQREGILLLPGYNRNNCPRTVDQGFCSIGFSTTVAITNASGESDTRADIIRAAGIACAAIVVFVVAIVLVLLCCRRISYRLNLKRGKQSNTPSTVIENSAYISVDNGVAASTNNIPVYAKPDKGNRQPANGATNSGYEVPPVARPRDSGYEEATLSPIRHLVDNDISNKPPATPPRPRSAARMSTPADGYEEANLPSNNGNIKSQPGMTNTSSGYEDNFVKPSGSSGYEDNFVIPQKGTKESIKYDHLNRKVDLDGKAGLDVEAAEGYGQVRPKSDLVDSEEYQHLTHDKKAGDREPGYGKLGKDRKS